MKMAPWISGEKGAPFLPGLGRDEFLCLPPWNSASSLISKHGQGNLSSLGFVSPLPSVLSIFTFLSSAVS